MPRPHDPHAAGFSHILDARVRAAADEPDAGAEAPLASLTRLEAVLDHTRGPDTAQAYVSVDALARAYGDEHPMFTEPELRLYRSDIETVAGELGLVPHMTIEDLNRRRRDFAMTNHPDRVPLGQRGTATRRMTIANMLVDQAVKEKRNQPA